MIGAHDDAEGERNDGTDQQRTDQADRDVAVRVLGFFRRGGDRIEAHVSEEDRRRGRESLAAVRQPDALKSAPGTVVAGPQKTYSQSQFPRAMTSDYDCAFLSMKRSEPQIELRYLR